MSAIFEKVNDLLHEDDDSSKTRSIGISIMWAAVFCWMAGMLICFVVNLPNTLAGVISAGNITSPSVTPGIARFFFNASTVALLIYFVFGLIFFIKPRDVILSTTIIALLEIMSFLLLYMMTAGIVMLGFLVIVGFVVLGAVGMALLYIGVAFFHLSFGLVPALATLFIGATLGLSAVVVAPFAIIIFIASYKLELAKKRNVLSFLLSLILIVGFSWPVLTFTYNFMNILPNRYAVSARNAFLQRFSNEPEKVMQYQIDSEGFYRKYINNGKNANISSCPAGAAGGAVMDDKDWMVSYFDGNSVYTTSNSTLDNVHVYPVYADIGDLAVLVRNWRIVTIYGKDKIYYMDTKSNSNLDKKTKWYTNYNAMTDNERMVAVYDILLRQSVDDGEKFTPEEIGWVAYAQASGFLVDYTEDSETAWFAKKDGDQLTLYSMDSSRDAKEFTTVTCSDPLYGVGYYVMNGNFYYFKGDIMSRISLADETAHPVESLKISHNGEEIICINYLEYKGEWFNTVSRTDNVCYFAVEYGDFRPQYSSGTRYGTGDLVGQLNTENIMHLYQNVEKDGLLGRLEDLLKGAVAQTNKIYPSYGDL